MVDLLDAVRQRRASYQWEDVVIERDGHRLVVQMTRDALRVGGLRATCTAQEAQLCADELGCVLPTARLLDERHRQATVPIDPQPKWYPGGIGMAAPAAVELHSQRVDEAIGARVGSVSPVGKHWILDERATKQRAVLYGWHVPYHRQRSWRGIPVHPAVSGPGLYVLQPVSTAHDYYHHDYSMTLVLCGRVAELDGRRVRLADVLTDPALCSLVLHTGRALRSARLPGVEPATSASKPLEPSEGSSSVEQPSSAAQAEQQARTTLAAATLRRGKIDLEAGVHEDLGRNDGDRIRQYAARVGATPPLNWCAAGTSTWIMEACEELGVEPVVPGTYGARALGAQFRTAGRWVGGPRATGLWAQPARLVPDLHLLPGQVVVWARGDLSDPKEWRGHVGLLERYDPETRVLHTVEPNSGKYGTEVARMERRLDDPALLGVGLLTTPEEAAQQPAIPYEPTQHELAELARLLELGAEAIAEGEPRDPLADLEERLSE